MTPQQIRKAKAEAAGFRPGQNQSFADTPTVTYVQQSLNVLGFDAGPVDGLIGSRRRDAIRRLQSGAETPGYGEISPDLLRRLLAKQDQAA